MKRDDVVNVDDAAHDDFVVNVKVHSGCVAAISHAVHGATPIFSMNSRTALIR